MNEEHYCRGCKRALPPRYIRKQARVCSKCSGARKRRYRVRTCPDCKGVHKSPSNVCPVCRYTRTHPKEAYAS